MAKSRGSSARFAHIRLENWRNFVQADVSLPRRVFLVGPNASGKSNLLDAFRFLRDIVAVGGGLQQAVRARGGVSSLRCLAARQHSDLRIRVRVADEGHNHSWEYDLCFNQDSHRRPVVSLERVRRDEETLLERPDASDRQDPERLTQTFLEQVNANQAFREVADFFSSVRYLHIVPQLVREPDRSAGRTNDPFGADFLEQIARTAEKTQRARLRRIVEALKVAVPQLQNLELWRDTRGAPHLRGKYAHWRPQGAWQTEERFSDGTLRLIGLLWAVQDGTGPLLLEEPELSLHPGVIRYLPQMFARLQHRSGRQVIISTHSAEMLRDEGIGLDEALLLIPEAESTSVRPASDYQEVVALVQGGCSLADVIMPRTEPPLARQLVLFGD